MIRQLEGLGGRLLMAVEPLPDELELRDLQRLHANERAMADGFASASRRHQSLAGRLLLRNLLSVWYCSDDLDWVHCERVEGAPWLVGGEGPLPSVSLSHCKRYVAAAIAEPAMDVGIDVECRVSSDIAAVAERFAWPIDNDPDRFQTAWTLWEAAVKARLDKPHDLVRAFFDQGTSTKHAAWNWPVAHRAQVSVVARLSDH